MLAHISQYQTRIARSPLLSVGFFREQHDRFERLAIGKRINRVSSHHGSARTLMMTVRELLTRSNRERLFTAKSPLKGRRSFSGIAAVLIGHRFSRNEMKSCRHNYFPLRLPHKFLGRILLFVMDKNAYGPGQITVLSLNIFANRSALQLARIWRQVYAFYRMGIS
jgi:hypothetical protein